METIHFFRAGKHITSSGISLSFSENDLAAAARSYDAKTHEAPLVIGHPPAFGWVNKVEHRPDGLHAVPHQLNPEFAEIVRTGAYKKVSAAFYMPDDRNNPKPGSLYLRHIGFLGAEPPAVKGLKAVQFSEGEDVFFAEEDRLALREHSLVMREGEFKRRELVDAVRKAKDEGRLPIGLLSGAVAFAESLSPESVVTFSEEDETIQSGQQAWFLDFISKLPVPVHVGEICKGAEFSEVDADFELPEGYSVDPRRAMVNNLATRLMREKNLTFSEAVKQAEFHVNHT